MKAQLALIEAFASIVLLATLGSMIANYVYVNSFSQKSFNFNLQNFFYDFTNAVYLNRTMNSCILNLTFSCGYPMLSEFNSAYGLSGSSVTVNNRSVSSGTFDTCNASDTECIPVESNSTYIQACIYACGG